MQDLDAKLQDVLAFAGDKCDPQPELIIRNPVEQNVCVYYVPPRELFMCFANVDIDPFATKTVEFALNRAAPVLRIKRLSSVVLSGGRYKFSPLKQTYVLIKVRIDT